jgi:hypothetical protein
MSAEFQKTIVNNSAYDPTAPKPPFFQTFLYVRAPRSTHVRTHVEPRHGEEGGLLRSTHGRDGRHTMLSQSALPFSCARSSTRR